MHASSEVSVARWISDDATRVHRASLVHVWRRPGIHLIFHGCGTLAWHRGACTPERVAVRRGSCELERNRHAEMATLSNRISINTSTPPQMSALDEGNPN